MSNPILNDDRFSADAQILDGAPMTIQGTVNKIFLLFIKIQHRISDEMY